MVVEYKQGDAFVLVPESRIRAVVLEDHSLNLYTTDGDWIAFSGKPAVLWEAYTQIRNTMDRPGYRVDLTWLNESPAPEAVATGD